MSFSIFKFLALNSAQFIHNDTTIKLSRTGSAKLHGHRYQHHPCAKCQLQV